MSSGPLRRGGASIGGVQRNGRIQQAFAAGFQQGCKDLLGQEPFMRMRDRRDPVVLVDAPHGALVAARNGLIAVPGEVLEHGAIMPLRSRPAEQWMTTPASAAATALKTPASRCGKSLALSA